MGGGSGEGVRVSQGEWLEILTSPGALGQSQYVVGLDIGCAV